MIDTRRAIIPGGRVKSPRWTVDGRPYNVLENPSTNDRYINQSESPRVIFVSLNIYKMRDAPVDRFISRFSLPSLPRDHYFLSLLPFRYYGLVSWTFHHVCVSAVLTEQCISRLWWIGASESEHCISDDWRERSSKIIGICDENISLSMLLTRLFTFYII